MRLHLTTYQWSQPTRHRSLWNQNNPPSNLFLWGMLSYQQKSSDCICLSPHWLGTYPWQLWRTLLDSEFLNHKRHKWTIPETRCFLCIYNRKKGQVQSTRPWLRVGETKDNVVSKGTWQCHHHTEGTSSPSYHCSRRLLRVASPTFGSGSSRSSGLDFWITPVRTEMLTGRHFSVWLSLKWRDQCSYNRKYNDVFIVVLSTLET